MTWTATIGIPTLSRGDLSVNVEYMSTGGESFVEAVHATPGDDGWLARTVARRLAALEWSDAALLAVQAGPFTVPPPATLALAETALTAALKAFNESERLIASGVTPASVDLAGLRAAVTAAHTARELAKP